MLVGDVMTREVVSVKLDDPLVRVRDLLVSRQIHHVVVVDESGERVVGIISDRDLLRSISPFVGGLSERKQDEATLHRRAHQIMSRHPVTIGATVPLESVAELFTRKGISCVPVTSPDGRLIGIVTSRDLLRAMVADVRANAGPA